jgi:hypothetical protein
MTPIRCTAIKCPYLTFVAGKSGVRFSGTGPKMERAMHDYSEDNFGARALNWVVIGGAALLFMLASFASVAPQSSIVAPQQTISDTTAHGGHA